jgi:hypothetical protein
MSKKTPPRTPITTKTVEKRITNIITNLDAIGVKEIKLKDELRKLRLERTKLEKEKKKLQGKTINILRRESIKRRLNNELGPGFTSPSKHNFGKN